MVKLRSALLLVLSVLFGIWWWHNQESENIIFSDENEAPLLVLHDVVSNHFDENGIREMILTTPQLTNYDDSRGTDYIQPVVEYFQEDELMTIRGNEGHLDEHKTLLTFKGNVIGEQFIKGIRLRWLETSILNYHLPDKIVDTNADVVITTPQTLTYATGATWHINQESFILKENVRSKYEFKNQP